MKKILIIPALLAASFTVNAASVLDFTDASTGFTGSIAGTTYALTGSPVAPNTNQSFDGGTCPSTLACNNDGVGISDDEVGTTESLTLTFMKAVRISALSFLDIFGAENALVTFDDGTALSVFSTGAAGGYAELSSLSILTKSITFTSPIGASDDTVNDFALASVSVSAVPVPAAAFLFAPALLGFMGLRRKSNKNVSA